MAPPSVAIRPTAASMVARLAQAPLPRGVTLKQRDHLLHNLQSLAIGAEGHKVIAALVKPEAGSEANGIGRELAALGIGARPRAAVAGGTQPSVGQAPMPAQPPVWAARLQMIVQTVMSGLQAVEPDDGVDAHQQRTQLISELSALLGQPTRDNLRVTIDRLRQPEAGGQAHHLARQLQSMLAPRPAPPPARSTQPS
jgi:hypothetical protein